MNDLVSLKVIEVDEDGDIIVDIDNIVQSNNSGGEVCWPFLVFLDFFFSFMFGEIRWCNKNIKLQRKRLSSTATDTSETPKKRVKGEKEERKKIEKEKKEVR